MYMDMYMIMYIMHDVMDNPDTEWVSHKYLDFDSKCHIHYVGVYVRTFVVLSIQ